MKSACIVCGDEPLKNQVHCGQHDASDVAKSLMARASSVGAVRKNRPYEVEKYLYQFQHQQGAGGGASPNQPAEYQEGWERIFGKPKYETMTVTRETLEASVGESDTLIDMSSRVQSRSTSKPANRAPLERLIRERERAGISSPQIAGAMLTAYPYLRTVERGLAGVTDEFLVRYRDALESLQAGTKEVRTRSTLCPQGTEANEAEKAASTKRSGARS